MLFLSLIIGASVAYQTTGIKHYLSRDGISELKNTILALGWTGALIYLLVYITIVSFGLPNLPFQLAAGALYGIWPAFLMMYLGVNCGAMGAFTLARVLGRTSIEQIFGHRLLNLNRRIETGGFQFILYLRLIPLMPFNAINYASGVSRIPTRTYISANILGMLPLTFVHVALGHAAGTLSLSDPESWKKPELFLPVLIAVVFLVAGIALGRRKAKQS